MQTTRRLLVVAALGLSDPGLAQAPPADPIVADDFGDNALDAALWRGIQGGTGPAAAETNQRLEIDLPATSSGGFVAGVSSTYRLSGDFDVQVGYALIAWPERNGVRLGITTSPYARYDGAPGAVERISQGRNYTGPDPEVYLTHFGDGVRGLTATGDVAGRLRLVRTGGTFTGYRMDTGGWIAIHAGPAPSADLYVHLKAWSGDAEFADQRAVVAFDDFAVTEGQPVFPPPPDADGEPYGVDGFTVALYRFDGDFQDAGPNGLHLTPAGGAQTTADNLGRMDAPAGQVLRTADLGDQVTVTIPEALLQGPEYNPATGATPLTFEARFHPRAWRAYGQGDAPVISLRQGWDATLEVKDGKWNSPPAPQAQVGATVAIPPGAWAAAVAMDTWHHLRMTIDPTHVWGTRALARVWLDGVLAFEEDLAFNYGRTGDWQLTLGNLDGDLDEVRVSGVVRPGTAAPSDSTAPGAPGDLTAGPVDDARIDLAWTAAADPESGVSQYRVFRDGAWVATVAGTGWADSTLAPGTAYDYAVAAVNGAGMEGPPSAPASAVTPVLDDFDDDAIDASLWRVHVEGSGPAASESGQRLELVIPGSSTGDSLEVGYAGVRRVTGDFDLRIAYQLLDWPDGHGVRVGLVASPAGGLAGAASVERRGDEVLTAFGDGEQGHTAIADGSGALRLVRSGGQYTGYYMGASDWVPLHTGPAPAQDVFFLVAAWTGDSLFGGPTVRVALDDFAMHGGRLVAPDTTAPPAPTGLAAVPASDSRIDLTWTGATDPESGIAEYRVYRDGSPVGTALATAYADSGLLAEIPYAYSVAAVNGARIEGPPSDPVGATTLPPDPALVDDFDDDATDGSLWAVDQGGSGPVVAEVNQRLEIEVPATATGSPFYAGYTSRVGLTGDFDLQVDYQLLDWPAKNGVRLDLTTDLPETAVERVSWSFYNQSEMYLVDFGNTYLIYTETGDLSGTLRLVRAGDTYTGYRRGPGGWVAIGTRASTPGDVLPRLRVWGQDNDFGDQTVAARVAFDNFAVNRGTLVGVDRTPPSAPTGLTAAAAGPGRIDLAWTAAADAESGVTAYRVYRDGALAATTAGATADIDSGLTAGASHVYAVAAVNGAGLEGPKGAPASAAADPALADDFDDNARDTSLWEVEQAGTGPTVAETNGRLEVHLPATSAGDGFVGGYVSAFRLSGDYDVQVGYQLLTWPPGNGVRLGLATDLDPTAVERISEASRELYLTHFGDGVSGWTETDHQAGALRLVRTGDQHAGYYLGPDGWVPIHTASSPSGDARLRLIAWSGDGVFADQEVAVAFDDFVLSRGQVAAPDTTPADPVLTDDFDDGAVDSTLWRVHVEGSGPVVAETGQRLQVDVPADAAGNPGGGLSSRRRLQGDFDLRVGFELLDWPAGNGVRLGLVTSRQGGLSDPIPGAVLRMSEGRYSTGAPRDPPLEEYHTGFADSPVRGIATQDSAGTLRLVRAGDRYTGSYLGPQGWVEIHTGSAPTEDVHFLVMAWTGDSVFGDQPVRVALDDFVLQQGLLVDPDDTPPSAPADLTAAIVSASRIDLAWTAAADPESGIDSYRVYRDGAPVATTAATTHADSGLTAGTAYTYAVAAVNGALIEGPPSEPASATTMPGPPYPVDGRTVALYRFDEDFQDAGPHGLHLTPSGGATLAADNLGWMDEPAGQVLRTSALGDQVTVLVPDDMLLPGSGPSPLTLEAMIYPRAYKAYGVANAAVVSLSQAWDARLEVLDGKWNSPPVPHLMVGSQTLVSAAAWAANATPGAWHHLQVTFATDGTARVCLDGIVVSEQPVSMNAARTGPWTVTLGNFDGDLDEVRISDVVRPGFPALSLSSTSLAFGKVDVGSSASQVLAIHNTGTGPLSVSHIASSHPVFTVSPTSLNVAAGAVDTVTVSFAPTQAGWEQGVLTLSHNAPGGPSTVLAGGIGRVDPPAGSLANTRIAFHSSRDGNYEIYAMAADGTDQTRLTSHTALDQVPVWSPDGAKILFYSERDGNSEIYTMNADGTDPTRLTDDPAGEYNADWSPDGSRIAFRSDRDGNPEIYTMNADGSNPIRLTDHPAFDTGPSWSPDGSRLAFQTTRDGNWDIYAMDADGSDPTRLTVSPAADHYPNWSPDGTQIAFNSDRDGDLEIYAMDADGSAQTQLTANAAVDQGPAWSPDGTRIAFSSSRDGNLRIYSMNADGSAQIRLTNNATEDNDPSWSPFLTPEPVPVADLRVSGRVVFASERDGNREIYVTDPDDWTNPTRLTNNPAIDDIPFWSPDGTRIAFVSQRDGNWEIYAMDLDGTSQANLTNHSATDYQPSWSPDGTRIAFYSDRTGNDEIYAMDPDGTNPVRLTNHSARDFDPAWSPDGTRIAFGSRRDGNDELYVMNADGTNPTRLTFNDRVDDWSAWSPDGTRIAFYSARDGGSEIYAMAADGSNQTRLTYFEDLDYSPSWSPDGGQIVFRRHLGANSEIYDMNADGSNQTRLTDHPAFDTSPDWQPFQHIGATAPNTSASRTITIENKGNATLAVSGITSSDGQFTVSPANLSVPAGGSQDVSVTFTPTSIGTSYATLSIASNDVDAPTAELVVNGTGLDPDRYPVDGNAIALYHFDVDLQDAGPNGLHLTVAGGAQLAADNLGWMSAPSGQVLRTTSLGDRVTVSIPDALLLPGSGPSPLTVDAMVYPRAYRAYAVADYPVVSLFQGWDAMLEVRDGKWNNPRVPHVMAGSQVVVTPAAWAANVAPETWHRLRLTFAADGTAQVLVDGVLLGEGLVSMNAGRTAPWTLTLGNFDGDLDEVRLSNAIRTDGPPPAAARPAVRQAAESAPQGFGLAQNYPNPFNPSTTIGYALPRAAGVRLVVYNVLGQEVRRLVDAVQAAGAHRVVWDGRDAAGSEVANGVYLCRLEAGGQSAVHRMLLLR